MHTHDRHIPWSPQNVWKLLHWSTSIWHACDMDVICIVGRACMSPRAQTKTPQHPPPHTHCDTPHTCSCTANFSSWPVHSSQQTQTQICRWAQLRLLIKTATVRPYHCSKDECFCRSEGKAGCIKRCEKAKDKEGPAWRAACMAAACTSNWAGVDWKGAEGMPSLHLPLPIQSTVTHMLYTVQSLHLPLPTTSTTSLSTVSHPAPIVQSPLLI